MNKWFFFLFSSFSVSCLFPSQISSESTPLIFMKRTPCYGECPQYEIVIYESGLIEYNGILFVQNIGCFKSKIDNKKIKSLKLLLDRIQFFDLDEAYISKITDIPSVIIEVSINEKKHRVTDRLNAPKKLKNLYKELDLIVDSVKTWEDCS